MRPLLCIYHGHCFDGFTAAWVVSKFSRRNGRPITVHPGVYGEDPPDVKGKDVIIVDFSYKRPVMEQIIKDCASLMVLDHHETAQEDLAGLENMVTGGHDTPIIIFDMKRSGAGIAWDALMGTPRPALIDHVEDRDLWRFAIAGTRNFHAAMSSYPFTFAAWDQIRATDPERLYQMGEALDRKHKQDVRNLLSVVTRYMVIGGVRVQVANLPMTMTSDAGNMMAEADPNGFAACYWDTPTGRVFSLRSLPNGPNVAQVARQYGGGGHAHAAGFTMPRNWEGDE